MPRFPIYLLLDVSFSMRGEPLEAVRVGVELLVNALRKDRCIGDSACISVIAFGEEVEQIVPLTDIASFVLPPLKAGGGSPLGSALRKVVECARAEVGESSPDLCMVDSPSVFILTGGEIDEDVEEGLREFEAYGWRTVVACCEGSWPYSDILRKITPLVVGLRRSCWSSIIRFIPGSFEWESWWRFEDDFEYVGYEAYCYSGWHDEDESEDNPFYSASDEEEESENKGDDDLASTS